jgi:hypothetical protein
MHRLDYKYFISTSYFTIWSLKKVKVLFYPMLPDFRNIIASLEGSKAPPVCPSGKSNM